MEYISNLKNGKCDGYGKLRYDKSEIYRIPEPDLDSDKMFTSSTNRSIVEKEFTKQGAALIQEMLNNGNYNWKKIRPLGFTQEITLGFGSMLVTYLNIANNCPVVLWYKGNNWKPLFERKGRQNKL